IESWRCFACLRITGTASASLRSASAPDFAIAAYFNADLSMRSTPSFVASLARIACFRSESKRSCKVMCDNYDEQTQLSTTAKATGARVRTVWNVMRLRLAFGNAIYESTGEHLRTDSGPLTEITSMLR